MQVKYIKERRKDVIAECNQKIVEEIKNIFELNKSSYGVRRVNQKLINRRYRVNHKCVQCFIHEAKLIGKLKKI